MTIHYTRGALLGSFVGAMALLAGCVPQTNYDTLESQYNQLEKAHEVLNAQNTQNAKDIAELKQHVGMLQHAIAYTVNSDLLFATGSWEMSDSGKQIIAKLATQIVPFTQQKIVVNGYTDNQPIGAELKKRGVTSNEMLSQKRAEAVMAYLISKGEKPDLVSAKGFGENDPVAPNDTAAGRAQNRRVEIEPAE